MYFKQKLDHQILTVFDAFIQGSVEETWILDPPVSALSLQILGKSMLSRTVSTSEPVGLFH